MLSMGKTLTEVSIINDVFKKKTKGFEKFKYVLPQRVTEVDSKGKVVGDCARDDTDGDGKGDGPKPKCMSRRKRQQLSKKERGAATRAKRRHDSNPDRKGKPINVSNFGKGKL